MVDADRLQKQLSHFNFHRHAGIYLIGSTSPIAGFVVGLHGLSDTLQTATEPLAPLAYEKSAIA